MYNETHFLYFLSGSGYLVPHEAAICLFQKSKVRQRTLEPLMEMFLSLIKTGTIII